MVERLVDRINKILEDVTSARSKAFSAQDEETHKYLGRAMSSLIDARKHLEAIA